MRADDFIDDQGMRARVHDAMGASLLVLQYAAFSLGAKVPVNSEKNIGSRVTPAPSSLLLRWSPFEWLDEPFPRLLRLRVGQRG